MMLASFFNIKCVCAMKKKINSMVVVALMMTAGCSSKSVVTPVAPPPPPAPAPVAVAPVAPAEPSGYGFDKWQRGPLGDVFFEFDSAQLSTDAQEQLKQNGSWLEGNSAKGALIEGHCDARGTSEYNLALGERRANVAKDYLVRLGVPSSRLQTVSYGEECPFTTDQNEEAWAKNRRAHFVVK